MGGEISRVAAGLGPGSAGAGREGYRDGTIQNDEMMAPIAARQRFGMDASPLELRRDLQERPAWAITRCKQAADASSFFSFAFSPSSTFSRRASDTASPLNLAFHL
jgi:hypothetical protein